MSRQSAEPHGLIAQIRQSMAATAEDPPSAGVRLVMSAEDVAAVLGGERTGDTVRDKHREWTKKNGFPAPIPGMAPLAWSGPQFMAWLRGDQPPTVVVDGAPQFGKSALARKYGSAA